MTRDQRLLWRSKRLKYSFKRIAGKEAQTLNKDLRKSCTVSLLNQFKTWELSSKIAQCLSKIY